MRALRNIVYACAASVLITSAVSAQGKDPAAATALFKEGREAFKAGDYKTACPKFAESQRLDPAPGTLFNLADCEERLGQLASSWTHWQELIDALRTNPSDDRYPIAQQHAKALEPRLPRVKFRWAKEPVSDAVVKRDGVELSQASMTSALPVNPGAHSVEVTGPKRAPMKFPFDAVEGKTIEVEIDAGAAALEGGTGEPKNPNPDKPKNPEPPPSEGGSSPLPVIGWITVGVGAVTLIVSFGVGGAALGQKSTADDPANCNAFHQCTQVGLDAANSASSLATVSTALMVVGGLVAITGVVLVVVGSGSSSKSSARLVPIVGPSQGGMVLEGRF